MRILIVAPCFVTSSVLKPDDVSVELLHPPLPDTNDEAIEQYMSERFAATDRFGMPRLSPSDVAWMKRSEIVPEYVFPETEIKLGNIIAWNTPTTVLEVEAHPEWAIKYHQFCDNDSTGGVNTNLREAYFLDLVWSHYPEITTQLLYLSGGWSPAESSPVKTPKMKSILCAESDLPVEVRYLIVERVGQDLFTYMWRAGRIPFEDAVGYGIQIFEMLQKVHSLNVMHGDIHAGNVAFKKDNPKELVLIDFGRAAIRPEVDWRDPSDKAIYCDGRYSMWESLGHITLATIRDDVYRAALLVAFMMYGYSHQSVQEDLCKMIGGQAKYMEIKEKWNFFDISLSTLSSGIRTFHHFRLDDILSVARISYKTEIAKQFGLMLAYIRGLEFATPVNHEIIINHLRTILEMHI